MINVVIFDIDGTLVDTVDMHAKAWQQAFKEFGKDLEFQKVREQIGKGGDQLMPEFLSEKEIKELGEKIEKHRAEIFDRDYMSKVKAFPQVRELAERIRRDGKRIVLASSATEEDVESFKKIINITDLLEADTNSDDAEKSKPEPDIFVAALKKIGSPDVAECVVVGDTPYDAIAAGKINLQTIGVLCGGFPEQGLREAGCAEIYRDPADLLAHYGESLIGRGTPKAASQQISPR